MKYHFFYFLTAFFALGGCGGNDPTPTGQNDNNTTTSTEGALCSYQDSTANAQPSLTITSTSSWTCSSNSRILTANGIPDHAVGAFPNSDNPYAITEQLVVVSYPLKPTLASSVTNIGGSLGATGYALNGVKIDPITTGTCTSYPLEDFIANSVTSIDPIIPGTSDDEPTCSLAGNGGSWKIEALGQSVFNFGLDNNNGHVQPDGVYHYHGMPEAFLTKLGSSSSTMTLIGWAPDGFPIYARFGYSDPNDNTSSLVVMRSSYQLATTVSVQRPSPRTYPMGTFSQDWLYVAGSGDLDQCNGREGATPEFPEGIYHYFATDTYPYFQRCVSGILTI